MMEELTTAIPINGNKMKRPTTDSSTSTSEGAAHSGPALTAPSPVPKAGSSQSKSSSNRSSLKASLERRPVAKRGVCQERVFKKLSGDGRPILKCGRPNADESSKSYLLCTIVGFRGRQCVYVEPIGTCGIYENEGRFLIIDEKSTMTNSDRLSFIDLPLALDVMVHELERISDVDVETSSVISLLEDKPVWRVKSFTLVEKKQSGSKAVVVVVGQLPAEHAVTVRAVMFGAPHLVHMGSAELPEVDSVLACRPYVSDYDAAVHIHQGAVVLVKLPPNHRCSCCDKRKGPYHSLSLAKLIDGEELDSLNEYALNLYGTSLPNFLRQTSFTHMPECADCCKEKSAKDGKKSKTKGYSRRKSKKIREDNCTSRPSSQLKKKSRRNKYADGLHSFYSSEPEVVAALSENDTPPKVVKPDPIRCNLCLTDIQPMDEVYYKINCLEDCHLSVHKKCMQESLTGQGLHKKKEYKDGFCPTEGCSSHIQVIYEYSLSNTESLYLKCFEKPKLEKKVGNSPKKDKKKDHKTSSSEDIVEQKLSPVRDDLPERNDKVTAELPVVPASRPLLPPPRPNRCIPLPVDIENVVPLVREKDALEQKYSVAEQHHKKTKPPNNKKKNVLNIAFGMRQEPMPKQGTSTRNQSVDTVTIRKVETPVQREIGRGWSQDIDRGNKGGAQLAPQHHYGYYLNDCNICLEPVWKWEDVMWCPHCIEPYHSQCVRGWLYNNASCPQCRRNWPDPVEFPGLGEY